MRAPAVRVATVAAAVACAVVFAALAWIVVANGRAPFDAPVLRFAVDHRAGWPSWFFRRVTIVGSMAVLAPVAVIVALWLAVAQRRMRSAALLLAATLGADLLQSVVKGLVERARPPLALRLVEVSSTSFPSGHATQIAAASFAIALAVSWGHSRAVKVAAFAAAAIVSLLVGASRVVLAVHWASDVVAGFALGGLWVCGLALVLRAPGVGEPVER